MDLKSLRSKNFTSDNFRVTFTAIIIYSDMVAPKVDI